MTPFLVSAPAAEVVSVDTLKSFARIDHSEEDDLLSALVVSARQWAEAYTRRAFITQSWDVYFDMDRIASREVVVPMPPLQKIASVSSFSDEDVETIWNSVNYFVDKQREPARLVLRNGAVWPSPSRYANGLKISCVCGYGDAASDVPEAIRLAIMQLALFWYENRGDQSNLLSVPSSVPALLYPFRLMNLGG